MAKTNKKPISVRDWRKLENYGDKLRAAEEIGAYVSTIFNTAVKKANRFLKPYGFQVSVELKFHYADDVEAPQNEITQNLTETQPADSPSKV